MEGQDEQTMTTVTALLNTTLTTDGETGDFAALVAGHPLSQAAAWINRLRLFFIFIPGAFGNVMILVIQRRIAGQLKDTVLPVFMSALAVSDLTMLTCVTWIYGLYYHGIDLYSMHEILCTIMGSTCTRCMKFYAKFCSSSCSFVGTRRLGFWCP